MQNRRAFLANSLTAAGVVACGQTAPLFFSRTAAAAPATDMPGAKETVLVVVQLTGGNDGLNTVVPFADDGYPKLRKALRIPTKDLKKAERLGRPASVARPASPSCSKTMRWRSCKASAIRIRTNRISARWIFGRPPVWPRNCTKAGSARRWCRFRPVRRFTWPPRTSKAGSR